MDRPESWVATESMFGGKLAGMSRVADGGDAEGGWWEAWLDPDDPGRPAHLVSRHPPGLGAMIQLCAFGRAGELGVTIGSGLAQDRSRVHRAIAASSNLEAARVAVDDGHALLELTDIGLHPDQQSRLFAGSATAPNDAMTVTAYREDGSEIDRHRFSSN